MRRDYPGLWIAEDGKAAFIEHIEDGTLRVTVTPALGQPPFPATDYSQAGARTWRLLARWTPRTPGARFGDRLDQISAEADLEGLGRTYLLLFAVENHDPEQNWGMMWAPVPEGTPLADIRIVPDTGPGFIDAMVWEEDEGVIPWAEPFTPYRKGTPEEHAIWQRSAAAWADPG